MTLNTLKVRRRADVIKAAQEANKAKGVQLVASTILNPAGNAGSRRRLERHRRATFTPEEQATLDKGQDIYKEVCFACHGDDGRGEPMPGGAAGTTRGARRSRRHPASSGTRTT